LADTQPPKRITNAQRAAYHEAGHAVACYSLRRRFERVSILRHQAKGTVGHVPFDPGEQSDPPTDRERRAEKRFEHELVIHLAGMAACSVLAGRRSWRGDDLDRARQLAAARCSSGEEVEAYLKWLLIRTENELRMPVWWRMVETLAAELLKRKQLPYTAARWVMESTLRRA